MTKRYFEIEMSNDNTIDRSVEGHESDCCICIVANREPRNFEEVGKFCKSDIERYGLKYVVSITELTKKEAYEFYNMENENSFPIFQ